MKNRDKYDWKKVSLVMTAGSETPLPEEAPSTFTWGTKTPIELKKMYLLHEDLKLWHDPEEMNKIYTEILSWDVTSDNKLAFIEDEASILWVMTGEKVYIRF